MQKFLSSIRYSFFYIIYGNNHFKNGIFFAIKHVRNEILKMNNTPIVRHNMENVFIPHIVGITIM